MGSPSVAPQVVQVLADVYVASFQSWPLAVPSVAPHEQVLGVVQVAGLKLCVCTGVEEIILEDEEGFDEDGVLDLSTEELLFEIVSVEPTSDTVFSSCESLYAESLKTTEESGA